MSMMTPSVEPSHAKRRTAVTLIIEHDDFPPDWDGQRYLQFMVRNAVLDALSPITSLIYCKAQHLIRDEDLMNLASRYLHETVDAFQEKLDDERLDKIAREFPDTLYLREY